jgi:EAL domain-containing protein (putative c-di-GMP-specific phosphodiesterase class I)
MSTKEAQEKIVANMRKWMKIEDASVASTGRIIEETENPIVRLVMEIIQRDSQMHHRVQELIADSLETKAISFSPDEVGKVWASIEKHIALEKKTVALAKESIEAIGKNKGMLVQRYLLDYLLRDEEKHDVILANLESIKKNMYPYG